MSYFNATTVSYKGSKRKLSSQIIKFADQVNAKTVFDGFSGTGIVSAAFRNSGYLVTACDLNHSSYIFGKVFLEGYNPSVINEHISIINSLPTKVGWLSQNYSGFVRRKIRGINTIEDRPLGLTAKNAGKLDSARDYVEQLTDIEERDKNALIFSVIKAADSVFNNSNDQKSSFKEWSKKSLKDVKFTPPTLVDGPTGVQLRGDIFNITVPEQDFVYLDPPYTHGVLYAACYHLNDTIALWDKPELDYNYAIPRPERASFKDKNAGAFYSKKTVTDDFNKLLSQIKGHRTVLSYSDAPRNTLTIPELVKICDNYGNVKVTDIEHKLCTQYNNQNKQSTNLKEYFIVIDK